MIYYFVDCSGPGKPFGTFMFEPNKNWFFRPVAPGPSDSYMMIPGAYSDIE